MPVAPTGLKLDRVEFTWSGGGSDSADRTPFDATVDTLGFASSAGVTVTATAVDELGGRSKPASATYTVVNPQVHLDTPLGPSQSSPKVEWTASAAAFGGRTVSKVQLLLDDVPVGTADTTAPFGGTAYLSTKLPFPGAHFVELSARVTDSAGAQRTTDVRNIVVGTPTVDPRPAGRDTGRCRGRAPASPGRSATLGRRSHQQGGIPGGWNARQCRHGHGRALRGVLDGQRQWPALPDRPGHGRERLRDDQ